MFNSVALIVENDFCVSCGSCIYVCPFNNIEMQYCNKRGKFDVKIKNENLCVKCNGFTNCLSVCPSYSVKYIDFTNALKNNLLGEINQVLIGYSLNNVLRWNSSSGGFVKECCNSLLNKNLIDGVIAIKHSQGLDYEFGIIRDVMLMPNSIYHNINFSNCFDLLMKNKGKYLIVSLPCHIASIKLLLSRPKFDYLKERIYGFISLICGYVFDRKNIEMFAFFKGIELDKISYRGGGRYRKTIMHDKRNFCVSYDPKSNHLNEIIENNIFFDQFLPQTYCLYCIDHIGYFADLVVGDAWLNRFQSDDIGVNIVFSRTKKGDEILKYVDNFYFEKGGIDDIIESQNIYAQSRLGYTMFYCNPQKKRFLPKHDLLYSKEVAYEKICLKLDFKAIIKINFIKKIIRLNFFRLAKILYILINLKLIYKYFKKKRRETI